MKNINIKNSIDNSSALEQWLNQSDDISSDLIKGTIYQQAAPSAAHSTIQGDLRAILTPLRARKTPQGPFEKGAWYIATEIGVLYDDQNACTHDLAAWKTERLEQIPLKGPIKVIPDWVCEITSSNWINDTIYKKEILENAKVSYYWIINPIEKMLVVMQLQGASSKLSPIKNYSYKNTPDLKEKIPPFHLEFSLQELFNF